MGLGGQIFSLTFWLRRNRNLPVHDLPPSVYRRLFAGIQMWTIATALCPVLTPAVTVFAGTLTGLFAMTVFIADWLIVCGYLNPVHRGYQNQWQPLFEIGARGCLDCDDWRIVEPVATQGMDSAVCFLEFSFPRVRQCANHHNQGIRPAREPLQIRPKPQCPGPGRGIPHYQTQALGEALIHVHDD